MTTNQPKTAQEYIKQLALALKKNGVRDIDDVLADYRDYFAQSKAKGYGDREAIRYLPTVEELASSYDYSDADMGPSQIRMSKGQPSSVQRATLFGASLAGDILLLPILFITLLMLACFGVVGVFLVLTGPLLFIPDSMLGQLDVARPSIAQMLPTASLLISSGVAIIGTCIAVCERIYSTYRASIIVRRWLLTGRHDNHLKLVPSISKQVRRILYAITLVAGGVAILALLILMGISWFTQGTINFPSTWKM